MTQCDAMGYLASGLVLVAFGMKDIVKLRIAAIGSNLVFFSLWTGPPSDPGVAPACGVATTQRLATDTSAGLRLTRSSGPGVTSPDRSSKRCRKRPRTA